VQRPTIKGGTYFPMTVKSICAPRRSRARTAALHLPGGLGLAPTCRSTPEVSRSRHSAASSTTRRRCPPRRPQIACVMGSWYAGGPTCRPCRREYHRAQARHDLPRRPAAGKAATGESVSAEELAARVHTVSQARRPLCAERRPRAGHRAQHRRQPEYGEKARRRAAQPPSPRLRSGGARRRGAGSS